MEANLTIGSATETAFWAAMSGSAAEIDGVSPTIGRSAVVIGDEAISIASNGVVIAASSGGVIQTVPFSSVSGTTEQQAVVTAASEDVTAAKQSIGEHTPAVIDGTRTLPAGGPALTIDGSVVSLASNGALVDGSRTLPWSVITEDPSGRMAATPGIGFTDTELITSALTGPPTQAPGDVTGVGSSGGSRAATTTSGSVAVSRCNAILVTLFCRSGNVCL